MRRILTLLDFLKVLGNLLLLCAILAYFVALKKTSNLPPRSSILPELAENPIQESVESRPFEFPYMGKTYVLQPVADYELRGLVVTHNDISALDDIYHTSASVDVRDICVIWGNNLASDIYLRLKYWSEPWTCNVQGELEYFEQFSEEALSNNHLLPATEEVKRQIQRVHRGDQIFLRGKLVNYYPAGASEMLRKTSTVRTDQGNGACEVIFVESLVILRAWQASYYWLKVNALRVFFWTLILRLLVFVVRPYVEMRVRTDL